MDGSLAARKHEFVFGGGQLKSRGRPRVLKRDDIVPQDLADAAASRWRISREDARLYDERRIVQVH
jgi:hypothetical protein